MNLILTALFDNYPGWGFLKHKARVPSKQTSGENHVNEEVTE